MGKKLSGKTNFRVVVEPRGLGNFGFMSTSDHFVYGYGPEAEARIAQAYENNCNSMVDDIKRHVDDVGRVSVEFDQNMVCEHCGSNWTEDSPDYNGGCCSKDDDNSPFP